MIDDRFLPRVWTDKGYYYPIFSELGITYENKNLPFTKENVKDINWAFRWHFNYSNENVDMEYVNTLEQCTGLKDKNGMLIYEGDIVETQGIKKIVKYNQSSCCFVFHNIGTIISHHIEDSWLNEFPTEIIGNIHEMQDEH